MPIVVPKHKAGTDAATIAAPQTRPAQGLIQVLFESVALVQIRGMAHALNGIFDEQRRMILRLDRLITCFLGVSQNGTDGIISVLSPTERVFLRLATLADDPKMLVHCAAIAPCLMIVQHAIDPLVELAHDSF